MNAIEFLVGWAVRSSVLIAAGTLVLAVLRVKDSSIRLAAWVAMLAGSLAIPLMMVALRPVPVIVAGPVAVPVADFVSAPVAALPPSVTPFDWARAGLVLYAVIGFGLLVRLGFGFVGSRRLLRGSRDTGEAGIRESDAVKAPVTLGIFQPLIVLPVGWREWDEAKVAAVLAHERSHIRRWDPAVQLLSAVHRAALWFSPLSWYLYSRIVRLAEEASDDAAMAVARDRESYAELLLEFMRRGVCGTGVPMARYGSMDARIRRVLDGKVLSRGLTRWSVAAIAMVGLPVVYVAAMASPRKAGAPVRKAVSRGVGYSTWLGSVSAVTATVMPSIDGQLMSVGFKEGQLVKAGDVIATVEPRGLREQLDAAAGRTARDYDRLETAREKQAPNLPSAEMLREMQKQMDTDEEQTGEAQRALDGGKVHAPITGVAGLHLIEPGNDVHAGEPIVTIAQVQPIAVIFSIPEDELTKVRARMKEGAGPTVEAWNRDSSARIATGRLTAIDNQIDEKTGTVKLKATFENTDNALFPNQFVNVRLLGQ